MGRHTNSYANVRHFWRAAITAVVKDTHTYIDGAEPLVSSGGLTLGLYVFYNGPMCSPNGSRYSTSYVHIIFLSYYILLIRIENQRCITPFFCALIVRSPITKALWEIRRAEMDFQACIYISSTGRTFLCYFTKI